MHVDHKRSVIIFVMSSFLLASCSLVPVSESPESWGTAGGKYGAQEWKKSHPNDFPTTESAALFCVSIAEEGSKKFEWTYAQQIDSSDACVKSFVSGLSK